MKCVFPQREDTRVPVLMEVLVYTKLGAKMVSVGSCVNFCRVKAVQVQQMDVLKYPSHGVEDHWRWVQNTRLFAVGWVWAGLADAKQL